MFRLATVLLLLIAVSAAEAQPEKADALVPDDLEWVEMAPGISFAAAYGEWETEAHSKFIRFEPGARTAMHTHSGPYHGVVLKGTVTNPYEGEENPPKMEPGAYWYVPAGEPHVTACVSEEPCLLYTHADGHWDFVAGKAAEEGEQ